MNRTTPLAYSPSDVPGTEPLSSALYRALEEDTTIMHVVEPYFAPLGKNVREWFGEGKTSWARFATGDTPNDRAFAVVLGYTVVGLLLAIYLNILTVGSMRSASRAVRNAVRQQLLVVKVAAFIVVELVVFPLGCGVMLDVCTVWLFPQGSFRSRAAFLMYAPLTAVFYHWVLGTMFMCVKIHLLSGDILTCGIQVPICCPSVWMSWNHATWSYVVHQGPPRPELPPYPGHPGAADPDPNSQARAECHDVWICCCEWGGNRLGHTQDLQSHHHAFPVEDSVSCTLAAPVEKLTLTLQGTFVRGTD